MRIGLFIITLTLFLGLPGNGFGGISESRVRKAIRVLISRPDSSAGRSAGRVVLQFAEATPDYTIRISRGYLPWAGGRNLPAGSQMLLAAFVAGNLQEQIRKNSSQPEPYAGALAVIEVYQKMARSRSNFKIPKVEKFIVMERRGVLRAHIESVKP